MMAGDGQGKAQRRNQFKGSAKFDEAALIRLTYAFCQGLGMEAAARLAGLSVKTTRGVTLALRARLLKPAFNRWHGSNRALVMRLGVGDEVMLRAGFFDRLASCAANETCARNYRLGNRKRRQCRACSLDSAFTSEERRAEAYAVIDAIHAFYERLGIRGEGDRPPVPLFRERLIHAATVGTVLANSRRLPNGLIDPNERAFLCGGTLLDALLTDLAADPL